MNQELSLVIDAALKLSPEQQKELVDRLTIRSAIGKKKKGDVRKYFGIFNSGDPRSADNDKIDADLAEAYWDCHEPVN